MLKLIMVKFSVYKSIVFDLNTSHVKVNPIKQPTMLYIFHHLNTSHVKVNRTTNNKIHFFIKI